MQGASKTLLRTRHSCESRASAERAERPQDGPEGASVASHPVASSLLRAPKALDPRIHEDDKLKQVPFGSKPLVDTVRGG